MDTELAFNCPHCNCIIYVMKNDINCGIFRHGYRVIRDEKNKIIRLLDQIPPHATKDECDAFAKDGNVVGCCKPFRIIIGNDIKIVICDYI